MKSSFYLLLFLLVLSFVCSKKAKFLRHEEKPDTSEADFSTFKNTYNRKYSSDKENTEKFNIFKKNKRTIQVTEVLVKKYGVIQGLQLRTWKETESHKRLKDEYLNMNLECIPNPVSFVLNDYADLTEDEFISKFTNINEEKIKKIKEKAIPLEINKNKDIPKEIDWRKKGEIKNKDINNANKIYILNNSNEDDLKAAVAEKGPIIISLPGEHFRFYKEGIFDYWFETLCKEEHNMLMTIVGYDNLCGIDYWIVKSPFGDQWGDKGYFRLRRGINTCQLTNFAAFAE